MLADCNLVNRNNAGIIILLNSINSFLMLVQLEKQVDHS